MPLRTLLVIAAIIVLPLAAEAQCLPGEPIAECLTRALQAPDSLLPPTVSAPDASGGDGAARNALILSLQNQVQELTATLARLIAERTQQPDSALTLAAPSTTSSAPVPVLTRNLARGDRGEDVRQLQTFFIANGLLAADSATGYFGPLTEQAVQQWQAKNNIVSFGTPTTTGFGAVGPRTRAAFSIGSAGFASASTSGAGVAAPISSASPTASNQTSPQTGGSRGSGGGGGTASAPTACAFNGQTVAHGASVTAYLAASVPSGSTCTSQVRVCSNGVLSGTYSAASCTVGAATACTWNGQSILNGQSVTAYQSVSVPLGSQCVSEQRTCTNGTFSGSYQSSTCAVEALASCTLNGVTVAHAQSATFYSASSVPFGSTCSSVAQTRTCTNGTLSGGASFNQASCTVADAFADSYACGAKALSGTQQSLLAAFDAHLTAFGDAYSLQSNRQGVLGNNEPSVLDGYLDAYEATNNVKYLRHFVVHGDRVLNHRDDKAGYTNYRGVSAATWSDSNYSTGGQYVSFLIEDGALIGSLAHFAAIVDNASCLQPVADAQGRTFDAVASTYEQAAGETVSYHLQNWHTGTVNGTSIGYYTTPTDADFISPEVPGKPVPVNYQSAMGTALAYLYDATNNSSYLSYAQLLANYVLLEMSYNYHASADAYTWPYWPQMPYWEGAGLTQYPSQDDLGHSTVAAEFARAMYEVGAGSFYATEMQRIAHVYSRLVYNTGTIPILIDGTGGGAGSHVYQFGRVAMLTPYDSSLWSLVYDVMITRLHTDQPGNLGSAGAFTGLARLIRYYPQ